MAEEENNEQHSSAGFNEVPDLLPVPTSWLETPLINPFTTIIQNTRNENYGFSQFLSMLSSVELELPPSPSQASMSAPITSSVMLSKKECSSRFEKGGSSGTINKSAVQSTQSDVIYLVSDIEDSEEKRKKDHDDPQPERRRRIRSSTELHNLADRRRRNLVAQRIRTLQALIPNCHKSDQASIVSDAIEYIKLLQQQLQMLSMPAPYFASFMPMQQMMGMRMGLYNSGFHRRNYPVFPPSGFQPAVSLLQYPFCSTISAPPSNVTTTTATLPSANESNVEKALV